MCCRTCPEGNFKEGLMDISAHETQVLAEHVFRSQKTLCEVKFASALGICFPSTPVRCAVIMGAAIFCNISGDVTKKRGPKKTT